MRTQNRNESNERQLELDDYIGKTDADFPPIESRVLFYEDGKFWEIDSLNNPNPKTTHLSPNERPHWLVQCAQNEITKQTEKAFGIESGNSMLWIPKSVIYGAVKPKGKQKGGFVVKDWFGEKNAQSGGHFAQINAYGDLI